MEAINSLSLALEWQGLLAADFLSVNLRQQLEQWEAKPENQIQVFEPPILRPSQKVVGGDISRDPINRQAAMLLAKAPWWAHPPAPAKTIPIQPVNKKQTKRKRKHMTQIEREGGIPGGNFVSTSGVHMVKDPGRDGMKINIDDIRSLIVAEIQALPKEVTPAVKNAQEARRIVIELCEGFASDVEKFRANMKLHLEDIRLTRMAMVTETAQMTRGLTEIRQFFIGPDYKEQRARLADFVDLCERLQKLKESGFLDRIADTMLALDAGSGSTP